jgi:hypothetical protein
MASSKTTSFPTPTFDDVQAILNWLVKGKETNLKTYHGPLFQWKTKAELLAAHVVIDDGTGHTTDYALIAANLIGVGQGAATNLIKALTVGIEGIGRMPYQGNDDGKYATDFQIAIITAWIDANCP